MKNFSLLFISPASTLKDALKQLDKTALKNLLVVENEKLVGTLSDGDIRRSLLAGQKLENTIEGTFNISPTVIKSSEFESTSAQKLLLEKKLSMIPIVDEENKVMELVTLNEAIEGKIPVVQKSEPINVPIVVMAGGKGTRLKPFTDILPKPLIPIGEETVIEKIINHFGSIGCKENHVIINYKGQLIESYLTSKLAGQYSLSFLKEEKFLGTAGSLTLAKDSISSDFILTNCDILVNANYAEALKNHQKEDASITILSAIKHYNIPYGVVEFGERGIVSNILEKPEYTFTVNTGVYIISSKCLDYIPSGEKFDMPDLINSVIKDNGKILTYPVNESDYIDIGQWDEYKKSAEILLSNKF